MNYRYSNCSLSQDAQPLIPWGLPLEIARG